jgi:hypothetical protein
MQKENPPGGGLDALVAWVSADGVFHGWVGVKRVKAWVVSRGW